MKKRNLIKRVLYFVVLMVILCTDLGKYSYTVKAATQDVVRHSKREKREERIKHIAKKINNNEVLSQEEVKIYNSLYDELEITLPEESIEWEIDHENDIGVVMPYINLSNQVKSSLCREKKTTVAEVGNLSTLVASKTYQYDKLGTYNFYNTMKSSFVMPGMKQTTVGDKVCIEMVPQGLTYYDGYFFISAYCGRETHRHNSVVYVVDASSKTYLTTLILPDKTHAGEVVYANGYLWVSDTTGNNQGVLAYYNYTQIRQALTAVKESLEDVEEDDITAIMLEYLDYGQVKLGDNNKGSFITTYNGYLCVGEYMENEEFEGELNLYNPIDLLNGKKDKITAALLPANAQGAYFYVMNNVTYFVITSSSGLLGNSYVHIYTTKFNQNGKRFDASAKKTIQMPAMIEGVTKYGSYTYFVFESCGKPYRDIPSELLGGEKIGRVCGFSTTFIYK